MEADNEVCGSIVSYGKYAIEICIGIICVRSVAKKTTGWILAG